MFKIAEQVRSIVEEEHPDAVCIELDVARYQGLLHPDEKGQGRNTQITYRMLASFQQRLAHEYGGEVGSEMLAAAKAAQDIGADVLFIDADANAIFQRMNKEMPLREKVSLALSAFASFFISKKRVEKELQSFQENEGAYMDELASQFPTLKRMLIDERNELMAKRIDMAASKFPSVLAVVGDGHVESIVGLLDRDDIKIYRLRELLDEKKTPDGVSRSNNVQVHFHYEHTAH